MQKTSFSNWSSVGLGTGRLTSVGKGTTQNDVHNILTWMADCKANVIDTADSYTCGRSEIFLGHALRGRRDRFVIITKSGYRYGDLPKPLSIINPLIKKFYQLSGNQSCHDPSYLTQNLERSLQRLNTDHVDCFLMHDPPLEAVTSENVQKALVKAQSDGKTVHIGVSSDQPVVLEAAINAGCYSVIQSPGNPSAAEQLHSIWRRAEQDKIHIIANHVFYAGKAISPAIPENTSIHEYLFKSACKFIPNGTILIGTKNQRHFKQCMDWRTNSIESI